MVTGNEWRVGGARGRTADSPPPVPAAPVTPGRSSTWLSPVPAVGYRDSDSIIELRDREQWLEPDQCLILSIPMDLSLPRLSRISVWPEGERDSLSTRREKLPVMS